MVGKPWFSGFQNTFYFFCAIFFDRVMSKNVILKTSKIPQNRLYMAKNQVKFEDFFKISIEYIFHILEAYNCQKELKNIKKHGFYRQKTSFFDVFCHLLKTRFSRYRVFSKSYNSLNNAFIDKIFSRDENLHLRADSNRSGILNFCPRVELVGGSNFFRQNFGGNPVRKNSDRNSKFRFYYYLPSGVSFRLAKRFCR